MNTDKLETLSLEELYALADKADLDLPPGLERPFVIEEIADALDDEEDDPRDIERLRGDDLNVDENKYSDLRTGAVPVQEGVQALPDRYNETMVRAIVRDPSWAFAYWDISDQDLASLQGSEGPANLFLRVAELGEEGGRREQSEHREYFDIPIGEGDYQWYINLPRSGVRFRIDLCAKPAGLGKTRILARSNELRSPRQEFLLSAAFDQKAFGLFSMSGTEDLALDDLPADSPLRALSLSASRDSSRTE